jgi:pyrroloquinoline quinone biosynthesis protein B
MFSKPIVAQNQSPFVLILGITQDGGYPHIGCQKECCQLAFVANSLKQHVVSLALVDPENKKWWLFEATPDLAVQLQLFKEQTNEQFNYLPDGIFLTHAHIGHYTGLMYLGREAMGAKNVPVYSLPKLINFLKSNGPWNQLVNLKNIEPKIINQDEVVNLSNGISVSAFPVPHRDEFSETAGFKINTSLKKYLFIPDIDKWEKWNRKIVEEVRDVDVALLDATFYQENELPGRDIKEIPHPLVSETMRLFNDTRQKQKIHFIHFNHSNPLLWDEGSRQEFLKTNFRLAKSGMKL